jgi:hypothetical protein
MANKKTTTTKSKDGGTSKQNSGSTISSTATTKKTAGKKTGKSKSSKGLLGKAKKVVGEILAGAAQGAVTGATEAGSKATGIGQAAKDARPNKDKSTKRKNR